MNNTPTVNDVVALLREVGGLVSVEEYPAGVMVVGDKASVYIGERVTTYAVDGRIHNRMTWAAFQRVVRGQSGGRHLWVVK